MREGVGGGEVNRGGGGGRWMVQRNEGGDVQSVRGGYCRYRYVRVLRNFKDGCRMGVGGSNRIKCFKSDI